MAGGRSKHTSGEWDSGEVCQLAKLSPCFCSRWARVCNRFLCYQSLSGKTSLIMEGQQNDLFPIQDCIMIWISLLCQKKKNNLTLSLWRWVLEHDVWAVKTHRYDGTAAFDLSGWKDERARTSTSFQNRSCCLTTQWLYVQPWGFFYRHLPWALIMEMIKLKPGVDANELSLCIKIRDCRNLNDKQ